MNKTPEWILALRAVRAERVRQEDRWGEQNHDYHLWMTILGEEQGELCRAILENELEQTFDEAVQVAAVAVAFVEDLLRNNEQLHTRLVDRVDG